MPTIAISTFSFGPEGMAREGLDFAIEHGFYGLELGSWNFWPEKMSADDVRYMRVQAASHGVELSIHFIHRGVAPATHDMERRTRHLKELQDTLRLAGDIGARVIVVHPGPIDCSGVEPANAPETIRRQAIDNLRAFLEAAILWAEDAGAVLCVENLVHVPGYVIQGYGELVDLVRSIDCPLVRIILDIGHADCSDGVRSAFEAFAPYLRHIHVHDSDGQRDHYEIGKAQLDFTTYLDLLKPFPFTLAMESRDEQDPVGCVLRSRDALKTVLQEAAS
jgi:sugar phosphate isomerase/epimerase